VRDEGTDADDRVVDVLRKFFSDRLADLHVGLANEIVGGREPAEVGHSLQVPDDDARFHADRISARPHLTLLGYAGKSIEPRNRKSLGGSPSIASS
jgi:hypothetical protein